MCFVFILPSVMFHVECTNHLTMFILLLGMSYVDFIASLTMFILPSVMFHVEFCMYIHVSLCSFCHL